MSDDAIDVPELTAGTHRVEIANAGSSPHEVYIGGVPSSADLARVSEIDEWIGGGQDGPVPLDAHFPAGHQTIEPDGSVMLTITLRDDHTYQFVDFTGDEPVTATASTP